MTVAVICVLIGAMLPYIWTGIAKLGGTSERKYDNRQPREWCEDLSHWKKRSFWAHQNSLEAFAPFAASVLFAQFGGKVNQTIIDQFCMGWVFFRVLYGGFYIFNLPTLRSLSWLGAVICFVTLFLKSI